MKSVHSSKELSLDDPKTIPPSFPGASETTTDTQDVDLLLKEAQRAALQSDNPVVLSFFKSVQEYSEIIKNNPERSILESDIVFLKKEMSRLDLFCRDSDFCDYIKESDVIEVYNEEHQQVFRNFKYFLLSSYSVYELVMSTWPDLFERHESTIESLYQDIGNILASKGEAPCVSVTPIHHLKERSGRQFEFQVQFKFGWPLFNSQGQFKGYLITSQVKRSSAPSLRID